MKTIEGSYSAELVEKKSKFICNLYHVENKKEAEDIILKIWKEYYDARHNCYAYVVFDTESNNIVTKTYDDGEPSGTAGSPILNALKSNELVNVLAIVTRYFGGILLGTGGLVRAYNQTTAYAIENSIIYNVEKGYLLSIEVDYANNEKMNYFFKKNKINILKREYLNNIKYLTEISEENMKMLTDFFRDNKIKIDILCQKMIKTA